MASLCAVSVDLDEIPHYHSIHGLPPPAAAAAHLVYDVALGRIADFAAAHEVPITAFAIGADLDRPEGAAALRRLVDAGHPAENHTRSHRYDLARLPPREIAEEVMAGAAAIERATGRRPVGFRAPGYTVSDAVFDALEASGVGFDSSVFPCPAYWAAKALVLAGMRLRGRSSASVLDAPRVMFAPARPYRPGTPWHRRGARSFVELPVQVTPVARLPFIGTSIALAGPRGARWLARSVAGEPLVNLELHGIDFLDAGDGLSALVGKQLELSRPLSRRLEALGAAVEELRRAGGSFVRLDEAADAFA